MFTHTCTHVYTHTHIHSQRVGSLSDPQTLRAVQRDLETALRLATKDEDGRTLRCSGVDPKQQRLFVMCYCHHQLARIAHQTKDLAAAK